VWFDRSGKRLGTVGGVADYTNPALSPDGNRVAVSIRDAATGGRDIWIFDLLREGAASRITFEPSDETNAVWSPDGGRVAYSSDRRGARDIYTKNASGVGAEELVIESKIPKNLEDWSPDGRWMVYAEAVPNNIDDMVVIPLDTRKPIDFLRTRFQEDKGRFSPDSKWLAYQSDESGRAEVYVQPFPPTGEKWQISNDHGGQPQWRGDGRELYYSTFSTPTRMIAVDIAVKDRKLHAGIPHLLFETAVQDIGARNRWVATRDGQKFLAVVPVSENLVHNFRVIVNWPSLLQKK
jgi:Tol biopolymer transport system component